MSYADKMTHGDKYQVTFISGWSTIPRVAVMKFLGEYNGYLQFDLRPLAGTQTIREQDVISVYESDENIKLPKPAPKEPKKIEP